MTATVTRTVSAIERYLASHPDLQDEVDRLRSVDSQDTLQECFSLLMQSYEERLFLMAVVCEKAIAEGWELDLGKALKKTLMGIVRGETSVALIANRDVDPGIKTLALKRLNARDQELVANDARIQVVDEGGDVRMQKFSELTDSLRSQVIGKNGLRRPDEQREWQSDQQRRERAIAETRFFFDDDAQAVVVRKANTVLRKRDIEKIAKHFELL
jgi:hypothetical protein